MKKKRARNIADNIIAALVSAALLALFGFFAVRLWAKGSEIWHELSHPIPQATQINSAFVILVADFAGDDARRTQSARLISALNDELADQDATSLISAVALNRVFSPSDLPEDGDAREATEASAQAVMRQTQANALIWGTVRHPNNELELHLDVAREPAVQVWTPYSGMRYALSDLKVAPDIAARIFPAIAVVIAAQLTATAAQSDEAALDHEIARLAPMAHDPPAWLEGDARLFVMGAHADGLAVLGARQHRLETVRAAVVEFSAAIAAVSPATSSVLRAGLYRGLASALQTLEGNTEVNHAEIVAALQAGIASGDGGAMPELWADMHVRLAYELWSHGRWEMEAAPLRVALQEADIALRYWTLARDPVRWARLQDDRASCANRLAELTGESRYLLESIDGHRRAIEEFANAGEIERLPIAQNNLGRSLYELARRRDDMRLMQQAIDVFTTAANSFHALGDQEDEATVTFNWADALIEIGRRESTDWNIEQAVQMNREVLATRTRLGSSREVALTETRLSVALDLLGDRQHSIELFQQAAAYERSALEFYIANGLANLATASRQRVRSLETKIERGRRHGH